MEHIFDFIRGLDVGWIYLLVFAVAYAENLFPPIPSDVIIVFAASLLGVQEGNALVLITAATLGSTLGFVSMYWIGDVFGDRIVERGKLRFIKPELIHKVEHWFRRHGYWVVIANRFLSGTRAVISFFCGMSEMRFIPTATLSALSALLWNAIIIGLGMSLGENWQTIVDYLTTYSRIITWTLLSLVVLGSLFLLLRRRRASSDSHSDPSSHA